MTEALIAIPDHHTNAFLIQEIIDKTVIQGQNFVEKYPGLVGLVGMSPFLSVETLTRT